jgi:hypothetical protein
MCKEKDACRKRVEGDGKGAPIKMSVKIGEVCERSLHGFHVCTRRAKNKADQISASIMNVPECYTYVRVHVAYIFATVFSHV